MMLTTRTTTRRRITHWKPPVLQMDYSFCKTGIEEVSNTQMTVLNIIDTSSGRSRSIPVKVKGAEAYSGLCALIH